MPALVRVGAKARAGRGGYSMRAPRLRRNTYQGRCRLTVSLQASPVRNRHRLAARAIGRLGLGAVYDPMIRPANLHRWLGITSDAGHLKMRRSTLASINSFSAAEISMVSVKYRTISS